MGCSSSNIQKSLIASLSEKFVKDAGTEDSWIPIRSIDQLAKLSLLSVVIKRVKTKSKKVTYRPYDFSLNDFLRDNKSPFNVREKAVEVLTEYNPQQESSGSGSAGIQVPGHIANFQAEIGRNKSLSFTVGNIKVQQLDSADLVKALTSRSVDMDHTIVKQILNSKGTLCIVCKKIVIEDKSKLSKSTSSKVNSILEAKPVTSVGASVSGNYVSENSVSIGLSAGTTLAYSVWELQVDVRDGKIVPMVIGDTPGGFIGDDVTDNAQPEIKTGKIINKESFKTIQLVMQPLIDLVQQDHGHTIKLLQSIMQTPTDTKIVDDIFDYAAEVLEYPENQSQNVPEKINLKEEGVLNIPACSVLLQTAGFKQTASKDSCKAETKKAVPVLYWPDSTTPLFEAFDYLFDALDVLTDNEIKALGQCMSTCGRVLLSTYADHYGIQNAVADITSDQAAAVLSLALGLKYSDETKALTFPVSGCGSEVQHET